MSDITDGSPEAADFVENDPYKDWENFFTPAEPVSDEEFAVMIGDLPVENEDQERGSQESTNLYY